ncbi:MAG: twin-arginine translocase subunit TatC [Candidatus Omnitrophica bacterium]|nr:twin-arginine translocase subunit TatC [Candidatus Omnitrophota bacterium]MCM8825340.1 twin-arginine translocase subunit TatC [Candidatus Omnitrophota bacterium]
MKGPVQDGTFLDHLEELRRRIICIIAWFFIACILSYVLNNQLLKYAIKPLNNIQETPVFVSPVEPFFSVLKVVVFSGLLLSYPFIIYQIYAFVKPALSKQQGKLLGLCLLAMIVLFYSGICLSHFIIVPAGIKILFSFGAGLMEPMIAISHYLSFIIWMDLLVGLIFQVPAVIFFLGITGIIDIARLKKIRKFIYVAIIISSAIITPTVDAFTMLIVSGIVILLYEISLGLIGLSLKCKTLEDKSLSK